LQRRRRRDPGGNHPTLGDPPPRRITGYGQKPSFSAGSGDRQATVHGIANNWQWGRQAGTRVAIRRVEPAGTGAPDPVTSDKDIMRNTRQLFTDLSDDTRSVKPSYYFMMRSLLHSRIDTGLVSNRGVDDEDVNVYLAHLLQAFSDPGYLQEAQSYLHRYDHEVFDRLTKSSDARLKYRIYKTNADFLLVSVGVIDNPTQTLLAGPGSAESTHRGREWQPTEEATLGRGRTYYQFAYSYSQMVNRGNPAVSEVLHKLSRGFDKYIRILAHLRGEYLDIIQELSRGEVYHLERSVNQETEREQLQQSQDAFLDAYAVYRRDDNDVHRARLEQAAEAVRKLDPDFSFRMELIEDTESPQEGMTGTD